VEFRDVSFAYLPTTPVLENLSFTAAAGEFVAIAGAVAQARARC
jgi:ABC-type multidrug transport system fused ATPase/permease subunit